MRAARPVADNQQRSLRIEQSPASDPAARIRHFHLANWQTPCTLVTVGANEKSQGCGAEAPAITISNSDSFPTPPPQHRSHHHLHPQPPPTTSTRPNFASCHTADPSRRRRSTVYSFTMAAQTAKKSNFGASTIQIMGDDLGYAQEEEVYEDEEVVRAPPPPSAAAR